MQPNWLDYFTSVTVIIGFIGVLIAMKHGRAANFVSAYVAIMKDLQAPKCRNGRRFLRHLQSLSPGKAVPRTEWSNPRWWPDGLDLCKCAKAAYDQFDIAGIVVWHSKIPNLLESFVAEYQDSIIACWEQGVSFLENRVFEMQPQGFPPEKQKSREELYQCFSAIYIMAKHRATVKPKLYPHYSRNEKRQLRCRRSWIVQKALEERNRIINSALKSAGASTAESGISKEAI